jgi:CheY-like chemotaxis protein
MPPALTMGARGTALVVCQEESLREATVHAVEKIHLETMTCPDFKRAKTLVQNNDFDLRVVDLDLTDDGVEFCLDLRDEFHQPMPVIYLVNSIDLESRFKLMLAKGTDLVAKPFLGSELALKTLIHFLRYRFFPAGSIINRTISVSSSDISIPENAKPPSLVPVKNQSVVADTAPTSGVKCPEATTPSAAAKPKKIFTHAAQIPKRSENASLQIKKILVPIDFSECSKKALVYAVEFAKEHGAKLDILYVVPPIIGHDPYDLAAQHVFRL